MREEAMLWDADGVIIDSVSSGWYTTRLVLLKMGAEVPSSEDFYDQIGNVRGFYRDRGLSESQIEHAISMFGDLNGNGSVKIYDGISGVVEKCHEKYMQAIASSSPLGRTENILEANGLTKYFEYISGHRRERRGKPHPDQLLECLEVLKVLPSHAYLIGDMNEDIAAARSANLAGVVAVTYGFHKLDKLEGADAYAASPRELAKVIEGLNCR